jgi:hypothetical protein
MSEFPNVSGCPQRRTRTLELQDMREPSEPEEVTHFIYHRHDTGSTWTLCARGSFNQRVHDSFNWIGQMFIVALCVDASAEEHWLTPLMDRLFHCQEEFYVWYDGSDNQSYAPAVAVFQALHAMIEIALPMLHAFADRSHTVQLLQSDVDEIVGKMLAEAIVHPHSMTSVADVRMHSLLSRLHKYT